MADFTALKTAIQNAIKQNGNEEITGNLLQDVLLAIVTTLGEGNINNLISALNTESNARQLGDSTLQGNINTVTSAITSINYAIANGCVYAGIATPTGTPATGRVFYLALTAGTYTNYGGLEVSQGINILKNNGSAWSLDVIASIDDAPTPSSNNLVKSGGVFNDIMTNGSAFDLSAYNNGTTYADLNAALTALNALPAAYKKGGMSMKFVQSSDNKYVQYFYIGTSTASTDFTRTSNWTRVDLEKKLYLGDYAGYGHINSSGEVVDVKAVVLFIPTAGKSTVTIRSSKEQDLVYAFLSEKPTSVQVGDQFAMVGTRGYMNPETIRTIFVPENGNYLWVGSSNLYDVTIFVDDILVSNYFVRGNNLELLQGAASCNYDVFTTQGVSIKKGSGTNLVVTIKGRVLWYGLQAKNLFNIHTFNNDKNYIQTFTLAHSNKLLFDLVEKKFVLTTDSYDNIPLPYNCVLLLYNNVGTPNGIWSRYYLGYIQNDYNITEFSYLFNRGYFAGNGVAVSTDPCLTIPVSAGDIVEMDIEDGAAYYMYGVAQSYPDTISVGTQIQWTTGGQRKEGNGRVLFVVQASGVLWVSRDGDNGFKRGVGNIIINDTLVYVENAERYSERVGKYALNSQLNLTTLFSLRQGEICGCPENSLIGFKTGKKYGFNRVRASVQFTSDNVPVLFHYEYLDSTNIVYDSNGDLVTSHTKISDYTYQQILDNFDFGLYAGEQYRGTKIASLEDWMKQCRALGQYAILELKEPDNAGLSQVQIDTIIGIVAQYGMLDYVKYSFYHEATGTYIYSKYAKSVLGYISMYSASVDTVLANLKHDENEVFYDTYRTDSGITSEVIKRLRLLGIKLKYGSAYNLSTIKQKLYNFDEIEIANIPCPSYMFDIINDANPT